MNLLFCLMVNWNELPVRPGYTLCRTWSGFKIAL